jgi:DNA-binding CsgD family transcriptional regulator/tetratricopeptide (TPR) repeat protein
VKTPPLLERERELAVLDSALARARDGAGSLVTISGEPGIGKSTLVRHWVDGIEDARILRGACDDLTTPRILGPFHDMLRGSDGPLAAALTGTATREGILAAMQDEFSNPLRPTVVAIDDLQWADEATLDAVRFLGRRIDHEPTVLMCTSRDDLPEDHPLHAMLGSLTGPAIHHLRLEGLSVSAIGQLRRAGDPSPEELFEVTGGNPFFLTSVLASPGTQVPRTVRSAVAARLRDHDAATRSALEQLAIAPGGMELPLVDEVVDGGLGVLAAAERAGLITVADGKVRYSHELTRRAVVSGCPASVQAVAHARVLAALNPDRSDPSRLLHHAVGAGDTARIARHAPEAARAATRAGAHHDAAEAYAQALRSPELLAPEALAQVLTEHARELLRTNQLDAALAQAERAVTAAERLGDPEHLGVALTVLADARYWGLRSITAAEAAERAVEVLRPQPAGRSLACAISTLAFSQVMTNRFDEARATAEQAVAVAREVAAADVLPHALAQRGTARVMLGDEHGMDDLRDALSAAVAAGHHEHVVMASIGLVSAAFRLGRLEEAERAMDVGLKHAAAHDLETTATTLSAMRGGLDLSRGEWAAAAARLEAVLGEGAGTGWGETIASALLGRLRARRGEPGATELLDDAWRVAIASGEIQRVGPAGAAWAEWAWLTGQPEVVRDRVEQAIETARRTGHAWYLGELLRYRALGRPAGGLPDGLDVTEIAEPWRSGLRGDWRAAADAWQERGWPYIAALERVSSGDPAAMLEGLQTFDRLGADAAAARVRRHLRELGIQGVPRGPQRETRENPAGLTPRQAEILREVATGATNAQIADRLVLSIRTVDHHVSAILTKLAVATRQEAVARGRDLGIVTSTPSVP